MHTRAVMWIVLGVFLVGVWLVAKLVAGVASAAIHLALVVGLAAVVLHFVRRARGGTSRGASRTPGTATGSQ